MNYSKTLDEALYRRGQGSMTELAEKLEGGGDLSQNQIYDSLKAWRREVRAGHTFDLALRVAVAVPELLARMAREGGFLLVPMPGADPKAAAARAAQSAGNMLAIFLTASADGVITPGEAAEIGAAATAAESDIEGLRAQAQAAAGKGGGA